MFTVNKKSYFFLLIWVFFLFLALSHWQESTVQCWIHRTTVRTDISTLFPVRKETFTISPLNMTLVVSFSDLLNWIDAFKFGLFRVPWTARRPNQKPKKTKANQKPKKINPEYSSEELMLKLKFQYFGHLMRRVDSLGKILMLGKIEGVAEDEMVR